MSLAPPFATSGISTAVTRLVADELVCGTPKSVRHILHRAIALSLLIGIASTALIFFGADIISAYWIKDMRAVPALRILCFSLPSMGVSSCLRGYFIARRRVGNPSRAQILSRLSASRFVMLLIDRFASMGIAYACMAVMIGDTVAEFASCGHMALGYFLDRRRLKKESFFALAKKPAYPVVRKLLSIAAPITAGRYINSILRTIENILVPNCLAKYTASKETGLSQFGMLKGMAMPLIFFPASFLNALSTLLVPEISSAAALGHKETVNRAVKHTLHITLLASILISGVFTIFSKEFGVLLYGSEEVGFYLQVLAPLTPIMYLESVVTAILKGLNQQVSSLKYSVADSALRIVLIFFLFPSADGRIPVHHGSQQHLYLLSQYPSSSRCHRHQTRVGAVDPQASSGDCHRRSRLAAARTISAARQSLHPRLADPRRGLSVRRLWYSASSSRLHHTGRPAPPYQPLIFRKTARNRAVFCVSL